MSAYLRRSTLAVATAAALLASACSASPVGTLGLTTRPTPSVTTPTSSPSPAPTPGSSDLPADVLPLGAGPHTADVMGTGSYPGYTVVVPAGWYDLGGRFVIKYPQSLSVPAPVLGLSVWDVGQVFRDPCHWQSSGFDPGPTVADLVTALAAQPGRNASGPGEVTLAGHAGRCLELSVPAYLKSSIWGDFDACDIDSEGHRDYVAWLGNGVGSRHAVVPGQVERLWILDVNGQRLVVAATYSPDTPANDREDLQYIVDSLRFVGP